MHISARSGCHSSPAYAFPRLNPFRPCLSEPSPEPTPAFQVALPPDAKHVAWKRFLTCCCENCIGTYARVREMQNSGSAMERGTCKRAILWLACVINTRFFVFHKKKKNLRNTSVCLVGKKKSKRHRCNDVTAQTFADCNVSISKWRAWTTWKNDTGNSD